MVVVVAAVVVGEKRNADVCCDLCPFKTRTQAQLRRHRHNMHVMELRRTRFSCQACNGTFSTESNRVKHTRHVHMGELRPQEPAGAYPCTQCNASFTRQGTLRGHVKVIHEGKKMIKKKCFVCSKILANMNTIRVHMKRRHGMEAGLFAKEKYNLDYKL